MQREITIQEFQSITTPAPGMLLVEKDLLPDKIGKIHVPNQTKDTSERASGTGVIIAMSPFKLQDEYEQYLYSKYRVGDRIGFGASTPWYAPSPPFFKFKQEEKKDTTCVIHVADVFTILFDTPEQKDAFERRVRG